MNEICELGIIHTHTVVLHDVVVRVVHVEVGPETRSHYGAGYDGEDSADLVVDR